VDYLVNRRDVATNAFSVARDWRFENDAVAAYVSDTFSLLGDKLKVTPGVRYEQIDSYRRDNKNGLEGTNTTRDLLPGVDVGYQANDALFLFANFHKSLRPVQFTQVTYGGENLAAERAKNYEAGVRLSPTRNVDTALTAFRFDFDNKLEYVSAEGAFRNLGEARHQGIEAELGWRPARVRGLQTNYRTGSWNWNVTGLYQSSAFSDGANTVNENATGSVGKIPSYSVWNAQVTRDFSWSGTKMKAGLALNNLLDRDYYFRGVDFSQGRMPAPGRAALLTLQMDM
ncbi:MAG: TonB-dependent siderophore receptor, partial [Hydrogenophilales bacterium 17-61-76]